MLVVTFGLLITAVCIWLSVVVGDDVRSPERRLMDGDLSAARFRDGMARSAAEDDVRHPLAVPPDWQQSS